MDALRASLIKDYQAAREALLKPAKANLNYDVLSDWLNRWIGSIRRLTPLEGNGLEVDIRMAFSGMEGMSDVSVLDDLRARIVGKLDQTLSKLEQSHVSRPMIDELIARVKDSKLSEMLKEFRTAKDATPNHAAIGFRTIVSLVLQQRAKRVKPESRLAKTDNLNFQQDVEDAIKEGILERNERRLLEAYLSEGPIIRYNNAAHSPSSGSLVGKEHLDSAVELLNSLLPTIIE